MSNHENYVVIGGSGFLGSYIVQALVDRAEPSVAVYDLDLPSGTDVINGATYYAGDILDEKKLTGVLKERSCTAVFHTVSPVHGLKDSIYFRINQQGTNSILSACQSAGVKILVFTSSTGVVWSGKPIRCGNEEEVQIPEIATEAYNHTKAVAEKMVIDANGKNGLRTAALRPCGMIGPRDRQAMWRLADAYNNGRNTMQMGDNTNRVDFAYAGNVADAHILTADRLKSDSADLVAGQIFFISNGTPLPYWNVPRMIWREMGDDGKKNVTAIPKLIMLIIAYILEFWYGIMGGEPPVRVFDVQFTTTEHWYNIDKARKLLGYEPRVGLEEASQMMVKWWNDRGAREHAEMMENRKRK